GGRGPGGLHPLPASARGAGAADPLAEGVPLRRGHPARDRPPGFGPGAARALRRRVAAGARAHRRDGARGRALRRAGGLDLDGVPAAARAPLPRRARRLPPPRRLRLQLRGGGADRGQERGQLPPARGPGAAAGARRGAALRGLARGARAPRRPLLRGLHGRGRRRGPDRVARRRRRRLRGRRRQGAGGEEGRPRARARRPAAGRAGRAGAQARGARAPHRNQRPAGRRLPGQRRPRDQHHHARHRRGPGAGRALDHQPREARPPRAARRPAGAAAPAEHAPMSGARAAILTDGLTKDYGGGRGLFDLDLEVARGEVLGFLGPNGAGKSTTMRLLLDLIRPTAGRAWVLGFETRAASLEIRRRVGYLPGDLALYLKLTAGQMLEHLAALRGGVDRAHLNTLVERFAVELDRPIADLSTGNRQKVGLVQAFMHDPELLILDEPIAGLDPLVQQSFHALLREVTDGGATVFLSSHTLSEVERVADRAAILRAGRLVIT